jgi:hypothetical protein
MISELQQAIGFLIKQFRGLFQGFRIALHSWRGGKLLDDTVGVTPVGVLGEVGSAKSPLPQGANDLKAISQEFDGRAATLAKFGSKRVLGVAAVGIEAAIHVKMAGDEIRSIFWLFFVAIAKMPSLPC